MPRQWRDVVGIIEVSHRLFDEPGLRSTAAVLGLGELLDEAFAAADLEA